MSKSEQINELATALCKSQGQFPILQKRTKAYNYMYADLAEIIECVQPVLESNGLSLTSEIDWSIPMLTMTLLHASGQHISCSIKIMYKPSEKVNEMQAMGSSLTYARRYAICCLLNLAADKESDDDGEKSSPKKPYVNHETGEVKRSLSDKQLESVRKWLDKPGLVQTFADRFSISESMSQEEFNIVMNFVKAEWERAKARKHVDEESN